MRYTTRCFLLIVSLIILIGGLSIQDFQILVKIGVPIWLGWVIGELLLIEQRQGWQYRVRKYKDEGETNHAQKTMLNHKR